MEFDSPEEFEAWLKEQSQEVCVAIATRAALRVWPLVVGTKLLMDSEERRRTYEKLALLTGWALMISGVVGTMADPEINQTAKTARFSVTEATNAARANAANTGADAAIAAAATTTDAAIAIAAAIAADADADDIRDPVVKTVRLAIDAGVAFAAFDDAYATITDAPYADAGFTPVQMSNNSLWHDAKLPEGLKENHIGETLLETNPNFEFLRRWYTGMVNGQPLDWELQRRVALIDPDIWIRADPAEVAEAIAKVESEWLAEQLPQAEAIEQDESDGLYTVAPVVLDADEMLARLFAQLRFSLDMALRGHNQSGFSDMCVAYRYLEHTLENCADDPNAVLMHLRLAREIIEANLASGDYAQEDGLKALTLAMVRHETQLRADHPVVREANDRFVAQKIRDLDDETRLSIAEGFRDMQTDTKARLSTEYGLDADTLQTDTGVEAQADAVKRSGGRTAKIAMDVAEKSGKAIKAVDGSSANKGFGLAMRLQKLLELISPLF